MPTTIAEARRFFRERTNERSTIVVPDVVIDEYIQSGLQALNRRIRYHYTDSSTIVSFIAEVQEYSLPQDVMEVKWVEWLGTELTKSSIEEWRRKNLKWRQESSGYPEEWAFYADKLVFRPRPNAAAVAESASPTIRYISRPAPFATHGMAQLNFNDWEIPIYWAIYEWSVAHPDSAVAIQRAQEYKQLFLQEAEAVRAFYELRGVLR